MDISEGRSEDSAGMAHESNARLQWPRAARVPQGMIWRSGDGQTSAIEGVGEEEAGAYNSRLAPFGVFWNPNIKFQPSSSPAQRLRSSRIRVTR